MHPDLESLTARALQALLDIVDSPTAFTRERRMAAVAILKFVRDAERTPSPTTPPADTPQPPGKAPPPQEPPPQEPPRQPPAPAAPSVRAPGRPLLSARTQPPVPLCPKGHPGVLAGAVAAPPVWSP